MATAVTIQVVLDDAGVVSGVQKVGGAFTQLNTQGTAAMAGLSAAQKKIITGTGELTSSFGSFSNTAIKGFTQVAATVKPVTQNMTGLSGAVQAMGQVHKHTFDGVADGHAKAHVGAHLLEESFGIHIPRALNQVISRSSVLGPIMQGAFGIGVFLAATEAITMVGEKIKETAMDLGGFTAEMKALNEENIKASRTAMTDFTTPGAGNEKMRNLAQQNTKLEEAIELYKSMRSQVVPLSGDVGAVAQSVGALMTQHQILKANGVESFSELEKKYNEYQKMANDGGAQLAQVTRAQTEELKKQRDEIEQIGKQGYSAIQAKMKAEIEENELRKKLDPEAEANAEKYILIELAARRRAAAETIKLNRDNADALRKMNEDTALIGLTGIAAVQQRESAAMAAINAELENDNTLGGREKAAKSRVAAENKANKEILELYKNFGQQMNTVQASNDAQTLQGFAKIDQEEGKALHDLFEERKKLTDKAVLSPDDPAYLKSIQELDNAVTAIKADGERKRKELKKKNLEEDLRLEEQAADASLPPWQRANFAIIRSYEDQHRQIEALYKARLISDGDFADRETSIERIKNARIMDENRNMAMTMGQDLSSMFDDMTSGNIGQSIVNSFKRLFFQILAQWLLTIPLFKQAAGVGSQNGGGLLGGLIQSIFGLGIGGSTGGGIANPGGGPSGGGMSANPSGGIFGGGMTASPAGISPAFGVPSSTGLLAGFGSGSGSTMGSSVLGGSVLGSSSTGYTPTGVGAFGTSTTGSLVGNITTGLNTSDITAGLGTAAAVRAQQSSSASTIGMAGLLKGLPGLALTGGLAAASKFGGIGGQAGALLSGLLIAASYGNAKAIGVIQGLGLGGSAAAVLLSGAAGGLLGFGIGSHTASKTIGGIVGGAAGASLAALFGAGAALGPVGIIIAGIIGLLGGIFGGIFGGKKRKSAAEGILHQQTEPQLQKIIDEYKHYQEDFPTASSNIDDLEKQTQDAMNQYGAQGRDVFRDEAAKEFVDARKQIGDLETERNRRSALTFGPPQFHTGGYTGDYQGPWRGMPGLAPNEMLTVLERGEFVNNAQSTRRNRPILEAINRGESINGGGEIHIHIAPQLLDVSGFDDYLRRGGIDSIMNATQRYKRENR